MRIRAAFFNAVPDPKHSLYLRIAANNSRLKKVLRQANSPEARFFMYQTLEFGISLHGSSCNYLFFSLILAPLLSPSISWHPQGRMGCQEGKEKKKERDQKKRKLYDLAYSEIVKSGPITEDSPLKRYERVHASGYLRCFESAYMITWIRVCIKLHLESRSWFSE